MDGCAHAGIRQGAEVFHQPIVMATNDGSLLRDRDDLGAGIFEGNLAWIHGRIS